MVKMLRSRGRFLRASSAAGLMNEKANRITASASESWCSISCGVYSGLSVVTVAPARSDPKNTAGKSMWLGENMPTMSPFSTPLSWSSVRHLAGIAPDALVGAGRAVRPDDGRLAALCARRSPKQFIERYLFVGGLTRPVAGDDHGICSLLIPRRKSPGSPLGLPGSPLECQTHANGSSVRSRCRRLDVGR